MDLCEASVKTPWFMLTNSYHNVARHVDLMFTPGDFKPVVAYTPATYAFCFKFPYCKETVALAQRINPKQDKVVQDMDMVFNTEARNLFCKEWKEENGEEGEDLYKHQQRRLMFRKKIIGPHGPTGTSYHAWLVREGKEGEMYKMTDRSLYGARPAFIKVFAKEEKTDGMSEDELAKRMGMTLMENVTDCNCGVLETEFECADSGIGCIWRPLFESCHPPELIDGGEPICATTEAPTMEPTMPLPLNDTVAPTEAPANPDEDATKGNTNPWFINLFKSREHNDGLASNNDGQESSVAVDDDDDAVVELDGPAQNRQLKTDTPDAWYDTGPSAEQRIKVSDKARRKLETTSLDKWYNHDETALKEAHEDQRAQTEVHLPLKTCNPWEPRCVGSLNMKIALLRLFSQLLYFF